MYTKKGACITGQCCAIYGNCAQQRPADLLRLHCSPALPCRAHLVLITPFARTTHVLNCFGAYCRRRLEDLECRFLLQEDKRQEQRQRLDRLEESEQKTKAEDVLRWEAQVRESLGCELRVGEVIKIKVGSAGPRR